MEMTPVELAEFDQWMKELDEAERIDAENAAKVEEHNAEWRKQWPHHCVKCGGWGMFTGYQSVPYGSTSASFPVSDPCEEGTPATCHRCGKEGLNEDSEGPCSHCGWNFDDGLGQ